MRQLDPEAEELTALVVLSILMINSFTEAHNISVWNSVELSLVIVRIQTTLNRVWGSGVMKCKAEPLGFHSWGLCFILLPFARSTRNSCY